LDEFNIGYAIVSQALWTGLEEAVRRMARLIGKGG
jgi:pyridoxine 5'-phosphate synthase PdxJ